MKKVGMDWRVHVGSASSGCSFVSYTQPANHTATSTPSQNGTIHLLLIPKSNFMHFDREVCIVFQICCERQREREREAEMKQKEGERPPP